MNWPLIPALAIAAALFWLGARRPVPWWVTVPLAAPGVLYALYYTHLFDDAIWYCEWRTLPLTELLAGGVGLLAGRLHAWYDPQSLGEKLAAPLLAAALVLVPFIKPLLAPLDTGALHADCPGEVCLQSTLSTCGPASAATLLKRFGIRTSEQELARECFTYKGGTESWYLARALRRRGVKARFVIERGGLPHPAIAGVVLPGEGLVRGRAGHFIAVLDQTPSTVTIADPLIGRRVLTRDRLGRRYHFTGWFLVLSN